MILAMNITPDLPFLNIGRGYSGLSVMLIDHSLTIFIVLLQQLKGLSVPGKMTFFPGKMVPLLHAILTLDI